MNKGDLAAAVADKTGMSKSSATQAVEAVFGCITDSLKKGEEVRVLGFGNFTVSQAGGEHRPQSADGRAHADQGLQPGEVQAGQGLEGHAEPLRIEHVEAAQAPPCGAFALCAPRSDMTFAAISK